MMERLLFGVAGFVVIFLVTYATFTDNRHNEMIVREASRCAVLKGYYVPANRQCLAGVDSTINVKDK